MTILCNLFLLWIIQVSSSEVVPSDYNAHLEKGCANEGLFLVNGSRAEHIAGTQIQRDMLNHIRQEFKVIYVAHKVKSIHLCKTHKYILCRRIERTGSVLNEGNY